MMKRTLSVLALSGLLLVGCSGGTTEVERTGDSEPPTTSTSAPSTSTEESESAPPVTEPAEAPTADVPVEPSASTTPAEEISPTPAVEDSPTPAEETSTNPPANPGGSWVPMDVTVTTGAEAEQLTATSPDFRAYIAEEVEAPDSSGCDFEFIVTAFHPDGFAAGQLFSPGCGGVKSVWGKVSGNWRTVMAIQSIEDCSEMAKLNIPKGIPDFPCLDGNGDMVDW